MRKKSELQYTRPLKNEDCEMNALCRKEYKSFRPKRCETSRSGEIY
jgi:hypothetical protein